MSLKNLFVIFLSIETFVKASENISISAEFIEEKSENNVADVFNGVYTECFMYLSYSCLQQKTLLYLKELNKLSEVSVIGEYVKFVKVNETENEEISEKASPEDLTFQIDKAVDRFFDSHILKFNALGKGVSMPHTVEEFVGRKRKGGGGGGGGHGGGDDGGKKKMMMMAMMCMKMKFMMMVPAMMGMMGMMSFKGMMFSMMSFMISKMMLLMKILEKKGGGGGGGGGGGDGGWAAGGGGGGGGWMPAGGQDYGGGGGGGGYDANAQWQRRSILDVTDQPIVEHHKPMGEREPIISYVTPLIRYSNRKNSKSIKNSETLKTKEDHPKSRKKRGIVDMLQNAYIYWLNQVLGLHRVQKYQPKMPKYKVVNGMKYVYYPIRYIQKPKAPRELNPQNETKVVAPTITPIATAEDFNKGEIVEGAVESRMTKKLQGFKEMVNDAIEDSPWQ